MNTHPPVNVPFFNGEGISRAEAAQIAGRSPRSIDGYVRRFGIGRRHFGRILVSRVALAMLAENDTVALRAYLAGDRESARVRWYFRQCGVELPASADAGH